MALTRHTATNLFFRLFPSLFWGPYAQKAREAGIDELVVLLSFDSDTDEDAEAAQVLFEKLGALEIPVTFAVPGAQLMSGAKIYKALHEAGARFINHGGAAHTAFRDGRYWSTNFYNLQSAEEVAADIRLGHQIFTETFSEPPSGFRAPHFGHFQGEQQLNVIYKTLADLGGYSFASTTTARTARKYGPVQRMKGLLEFPIVGRYKWPTRIFDSWGHVADKRTRRVNDLYAQRLLDSILTFQQKSIPAVLNYYADPSHVFENEAYFAALKQAKEAGVRFVDYPDLIAQLGKPSK